MMDICFYKDKTVPKEEAQISIASHSLQYGSTCFAGIRGYVRDGRAYIFRLRDHFKRLMNASKIMGFGFAMSFDTFESIIADLIKENAPTTDFYIRPFLFSDNEVIGVSYGGITFNLAIYMVPLKSYYKVNQGLRMMVSSWQKISDAAISTKAKAGGSYLNSSLATNEAKAAGYDEALMMDHNQNIVEASVANLFLVYRGEIFTPPVSSDVLEGITMRTIIELLKEKGYTVRHEPISRSMLYTCDELFLTGTAAGVVVAQSVDGRMIGEGKERKVAQEVREAYQSIINMRHPKSQEWMSEFEIWEVCHEAY